MTEITAESLGSGGPFHVYAVFNTGREHWCVLTPYYHTVTYMLRKNVNTNLAHNYDCEGECPQRYERLIPRARASQLMHLYEQSLFRDFLGDQVRLHINAKRMASTSLMMSNESQNLCMSQVHFYIAQQHTDSGWCLMAGFDVVSRK